MYASSAVLVLILTGYKDAEGYMPGKLFEYLATGLPVLGVGPVDGDASHALKQTGAGEFFEGTDQRAIVGFLKKSYAAWKEGNVSPHGAFTDYTRKSITGTLADCLNHL